MRQDANSPECLAALQTRLLLALTVWWCAGARSGRRRRLPRRRPRSSPSRRSRSALRATPRSASFPSPTRSTPRAPKSCRPKNSPPASRSAGVDYRYGIGQLEVTVAQYVAFLNTADPRAATGTSSTAPPRARSEWPKYGQIDFSAGAADRPPLHGRLAGMGRQALRLRQLPALGSLRQLALQRPAALQAGQRRRRLPATSPTGCGSRARPSRGCTT